MTYISNEDLLKLADEELYYAMEDCEGCEEGLWVTAPSGTHFYVRFGNDDIEELAREENFENINDIEKPELKISDGMSLEDRYDAEREHDEEMSEYEDAILTIVSHYYDQHEWDVDKHFFMEQIEDIREALKEADDEDEEQA